MRSLASIRYLIGLFWLIGQFYIIWHPKLPMVQRPLHAVLAMALVILWVPLSDRRIPFWLRRGVDVVLLAGVGAATVYFLSNAMRLTERMENIDPVFYHDILFGGVTLLIMLECVRRVVGWTLLGVILGFLIYMFGGRWFPGWLTFQGFGIEEAIEILTMTPNGIFGITTETSVQFVFYFVAFGAIYSAIGGSQVFIDIGLRVGGLQKGGSAKAAVISSSLMGSISGSAVANVSATGVFTIPLMRRTGLSATHAAATEAIASTGGQLMPPIMGIAAFVMAELLQINYGLIALAGVIPALAFYFALFLAIDLGARKSGLGTLSVQEFTEVDPILPRLHLLIPPVVLVGVLVAGYSATYAAVMGCFACPVAAFLRRNTWLTLSGLREAMGNAPQQAAKVAVPIAAIGIVIAVAIQSNLALKFSTHLIELSGGVVVAAMALIILGCIIMGMGLPTVAAYIIGAILFVPTLIELGLPELSAHFFVMYYCVLSMVTPPVALASYAAAGLAGANTMVTSLLAFRMSLVSFFIPFAFAFDESLLAQGPVGWVLVACIPLLLGTGAWTVALAGYLRGPLRLFERALFALSALILIFSPTGTVWWSVGLVALAVLLSWQAVLRPHFAGTAKMEALGRGLSDHADP